MTFFSLLSPRQRGMGGADLETWLPTSKPNGLVISEGTHKGTHHGQFDTTVGSINYDSVWDWAEG